jgi:hypothetical protein
MIDDQNVDRAFCGFQFQPQLLFERCEQGRFVGIDRRWWFGARRQSKSVCTAFVWRGRPFQRKIEAAREACSIKYWAS